jgi:hypothetical protein
VNLHSKPVRVLGLFVCIVCTILILVPYGYRSGQAGPGFEYLGTQWTEEKYSDLQNFIYQAFPGILFSVYVVVFFFAKSTLTEQFLNIAMLFFMYVLFYYVGMFSLGILNILTGGIGALCINNLLSKKILRSKSHVFLVGMAASTFGLICAYYFSDPDNTNKLGLTIILSCLPWQIIIGFLLLETSVEV